METVTFALTPHTSAIIVQRRRYVDAILRSMETKKQLRSRVLIWVTVGIVTVLTAVLLVMQVLGI